MKKIFKSARAVLVASAFFMAAESAFSQSNSDFMFQATKSAGTVTCDSSAKMSGTTAETTFTVKGNLSVSTSSEIKVTIASSKSKLKSIDIKKVKK